MQVKRSCLDIFSRQRWKDGSRSPFGWGGSSSGQSVVLRHVRPASGRIGRHDRGQCALRFETSLVKSRWGMDAPCRSVGPPPHPPLHCVQMICETLARIQRFLAQFSQHSQFSSCSNEVPVRRRSCAWRVRAQLHLNYVNPIQLSRKKVYFASKIL